MRSRSKVVSTVCGSALVALVLVPTGAAANQISAPPAVVAGVARDLGITTEQARDRLDRQDRAHQVRESLPNALRAELAGEWFDAATGKLTVAVTDESAATRARAAGAEAKLVRRSGAELDRLYRAVHDLAGRGVPGLYGWGVDVVGNTLRVNVDTSKRTAATDQVVTAIKALGDGVQVVETGTSPRQQSGDVRTGSPWWPGGESNCSVGFPVTDANGGKHMLTAGHCTNDANQPAYGASGQQNKIGTSNVGGTRSVNAREGDMGVVAVTEAGWNLSALVNTWGEPAVTVVGSAEALVGDTVCHSGNTSHWKCGEVKYTHKAVTYGSLVIEDLTWTTACSLGGDSGGGWLLGDKAVGLHDGGPSQCVTNPSDGDMSIYQPVVEALTKWSLTLVTGGGGGGDATPPSVPANARSTGATSGSVSLAWDASTDEVGVTGYEVYNGGTLAATVAGTSATVSGLAADTAYSFTVAAKDAAGNRSKASNAVAVRTQPGSGGGRTFTNGADYPIRDFQVAVSPVTSTATGAASSPVQVSVTARHTCLEDLNITLVSPSGRWYALQRYGGSTCTPFPGTKTYSVPATEQAGGTWTLRIGDNGPGDTGTLDSWSVSL
jgi:streptogrisin C